MQFLGAWDEFSKGSVPNWEIDSVTLVSGVPEPGALALAAFAAAAGLAYVRRQRA